MSELSSFHNGAKPMFKMHLDFLTIQTAIYFKLWSNYIEKFKKYFILKFLFHTKKIPCFFIFENTTYINVLLKTGKAMSIYNFKLLKSHTLGVSQRSDTDSLSK